MGLGAMVAAGVGAAASIGSGIIASNASKKASRAQVAASEKADKSKNIYSNLLSTYS
jgi:F0F1-type ATP synthase membrane subunit c/vacuolar-type H+-ATPase subunit K